MDTVSFVTDAVTPVVCMPQIETDIETGPLKALSNLKRFENDTLTMVV